MLTFDLFTSKVKFASLFVWAIYIYIESIEVTFTQVSEPWPVGLLFLLLLCFIEIPVFNGNSVDPGQMSF